ncbi:hypothetical protein ACGFZQ_39255 [Streptomyces sp. NPDC048254]
MRHSHAHRLKPNRQLPLAAAFQLFLNNLNRGSYHQVSLLAPRLGRPQWT